MLVFQIEESHKGSDGGRGIKIIKSKLKKMLVKDELFQSCVSVSNKTSISDFSSSCCCMLRRQNNLRKPSVNTTQSIQAKVTCFI